MGRRKSLASSILKASRFISNPRAALRPKSLRFQISSLAKSAKKIHKAHQELTSDYEREAERKVRIQLRSPENTASYEAKLKKKLQGDDYRIFYKQLVGVSFANPDDTNRKDGILRLKELDELKLVRQPDHPNDSNAIFVTNLAGRGLGYLDARLAGEVSRSMAKGVSWHCFVRRLLTTEGTDHVGLTVCLAKQKVTPKRRVVRPSKLLEPTPVQTVPAQLPSSTRPTKTSSNMSRLIDLVKKILRGSSNSEPA